MKKNRFLKFFKWLHRWPGLIAAIFIICWSISGIVLNHRHTFSAFDINRNILAEEYQYQNWNNASLRGSVKIGNDSNLVYGNIGTWLTNSEFSEYTNFNSGLPEGIDHRKIFKIFKTKNGNLLAGTLFGLYNFNEKIHQWEKVKLPDDEKKIIGITQKDDSIYIMSRSFIFTSIDKYNFSFKKIRVPEHEGYDNKIGLFKTLWVIHSGELYGSVGKLIVDFVAFTFVFFTITGLIYYFVPGILKRRKKRSKDNAQIKKINKFSIKWHNKLGIYLGTILVVTTFTGMFLRPPLLIAIASSRVDKIPYTSLDDPNPWNDRFRDIMYDDELGRFLIGTVEGIYFSEDNFETKLSKPEVQPPISVMGINVFEKNGKGDYLVGSFYGLYRWAPDYFIVQDYINQTTNFSIDRNGPPLGRYLSAGYIKDIKGHEYHIDYNSGAMPLFHQNEFTKMPENIISHSPMSLWNFALEVHTARVFKFLFGNLYILIIPLLGFFTLTILFTGLIIWIKLYIRRKNKA